MLMSDIIDENYDLREYPALAYLMNRWADERPFEGLKILVATPIFRNTLVQYRTLLSGGAEIFVGYSLGVNGAAMPHDDRVVDLLKEWAVPVITDEDVRVGRVADDFDLVFDCAGQFSFCRPRKGFVELTRSGVQFFENSQSPVYVADSGIVKRIETTLGTGDGYFRALEQLGLGSAVGSPVCSFENKKLVVFGSGKVGCGIALQGVRRGMEVAVITDTSRRNTGNDFSLVLENNGVKIADFKDDPAVARLVADSQFLVTATGRKNALTKTATSAIMNRSDLVVANMGVEDEFGDDVPASRVLNKKAPLNFMLEEPTHLKYIETSLALHAALGERLLQEFDGAEPPFTGVNEPPSDLEQVLLNVTIQNGCIGPEICDMLR